MSSSISSSDDPRAWSRCLAACIGALGGGALLILLLMVLVDPYDSGKLGLLGIRGIDDGNTYTGSASRARDPDFDAAIIGSSTSQLIDPDALSRATALHFVHLHVTGSPPAEQLMVLRFFLRHHDKVGALVIITDPPWCAHLREGVRPSFPSWIYDDSRLTYAVRLISWPTIERAFQRLGIGLGLKPRMVPNGFWTYEDIWPPGPFREINPPSDPAPAATPDQRTLFPAIAELDAIIRTLPADVPVVLAVPPTFASQVPISGTDAAAEHRACDDALKAIVAGRLHSNFIDYRVDNAWTRDRANFVDFIHYRAKLARKLEVGIAASLRLGDKAQIDF